MRYLALIYSPEDGPALPPSEVEKVMQGYRDFNVAANAKGALLAGEALQPAAAAKSVRIRDGETVITDGPFAETREVLGGFYLLECETEEEALALATKIPTAAWGTIEVRPIRSIA